MDNIASSGDLGDGTTEVAFNQPSAHNAGNSRIGRPKSSSLGEDKGLSSLDEWRVGWEIDFTRSNANGRFPRNLHRNLARTLPHNRQRTALQFQSPGPIDIAHHWRHQTKQRSGRNWQSNVQIGSRWNEVIRRRESSIAIDKEAE